MKALFVAVLAVLAVQGGIGVLVVWSGLYNVAASEQHLSWTTWISGRTLQNSVETHAMPLSAPALDDPRSFIAGWGHYEGACSPCHGAPDERRNAVALRMLPQPPYLADRVQEWRPEELFWIVKHGFKYTGMPAWPAQNPTTRSGPWWPFSCGFRIFRLKTLSGYRAARRWSIPSPCLKPPHHCRRRTCRSITCRLRSLPWHAGARRR